MACAGPCDSVSRKNSTFFDHCTAGVSHIEHPDCEDVLEGKWPLFFEAGGVALNTSCLPYSGQSARDAIDYEYPQVPDYEQNEQLKRMRLEKGQYVYGPWADT
jgi:hypothetical protein